MDAETRLAEALDDVARIHPRIHQEYEVGTSYAWYDDRWARGAFALFTPDQQTQLQSDSSAPKAASTSPASTARSIPRGSEARARADPRRQGSARGAALQLEKMRLHSARTAVLRQFIPLITCEPRLSDPTGNALASRGGAVR
jgi:hypothetical protein